MRTAGESHQDSAVSWMLCSAVRWVSGHQGRLVRNSTFIASTQLADLVDLTLRSILTTLRPSTIQVAAQRQNSTWRLKSTTGVSHRFSIRFLRVPGIILSGHCISYRPKARQTSRMPRQTSRMTPLRPHIRLTLLRISRQMIRDHQSHAFAQTTDAKPDSNRPRHIDDRCLPIDCLRSR